MGLIKCPKCGEMVSDKAGKCLHCNADLYSPKQVTCSDCGKDYEESLATCPSCGCPNPIKVKKKKKKRLIGNIIAAIILLMMMMGDISKFRERKENKYYNNFANAVNLITNNSAEVAKTGELIAKTWYNAILQIQDEETDKYTMRGGEYVENFNEALENLWTDEDFISKGTEINNGKSEVIAAMKKVKNPPSKYKKANSELKEYYDIYLKLVNEVCYVSGSYDDYVNSVNEYANRLYELRQKLEIYNKE